MGSCSSSTVVTVDPHTGQTKTKKRLGGAYPGRRQTGAAPADTIAVDGVPTTTTHFQAVPGGTALQLMQGGPPPTQQQQQQQQIQVTLPDGVSSGQTIHVQAPDGSVNAIVVPAGFGPGSTFTVAFDPATTTTTSQQPSPASPMAEAYVPVPQPTTGDDGFVSGFGSLSAPPSAAATTNFSDQYYAQYPTQPVATAVPSNNYKY